MVQGESNYGHLLRVGRGVGKLGRVKQSRGVIAAGGDPHIIPLKSTVRLWDSHGDTNAAVQRTSPSTMAHGPIVDIESLSADCLRCGVDCIHIERCLDGLKVKLCQVTPSAYTMLHDSAGTGRSRILTERLQVRSQYPQRFDTTRDSSPVGL